MSGNGVFNSVSANGMNVTGILQASQIVTTQPMQVSNLTATNLTLPGEVKGDLHVQGNVIAGGYVYGPNGIDTQNLTDRIAMDPSQIYGYNQYSDNAMSNYYIKPTVTTTSLVLRDENGPTSLLTSSTSHNDPVATTRFGQPAPLIKIEDNGSYTYINVASNTIQQICSIMLPSTPTANVFTLKLATTNPAVEFAFPGGAPINGQPYASYSNVVDSYIDYVAICAKRGIPLPCPNGCSTYNTRNIYFQTTQVGDYPTRDPNGYLLPPGVGPVQIAIDVNPYLDGKASMNLYFCGGFELIVPIDLPGQNFGTQMKVPAMSMPVTTNGAEYENKVANGQNVLYHNTKLNILNINIVNFGGGYSTSIIDVSNVFGSNLLTSTPQSFSGSFGFFQTSSKSTSTFRGAEIPDSNASITVVSGSVPVTASPSSAEYMIQVGSQTKFVYSLSNATATNTYTSTILNTYDGVSDYWALSQYDHGSGFNVYTYAPGGEENTGMPWTNTSSFGKNDFYPFLNTNKGKSSHSYSGFTNICINVGDLEVGPEAVASVPPSQDIIEFHVFSTFAHETAHVSGYSIGISQRDNAVRVVDDEWMASVMQYSAAKNGLKTPGSYRSSVPSQAASCIHALVRNGSGAFNPIGFDYLAKSLMGTNLNVHNLAGVGPYGPYATPPSQNSPFSKYSHAYFQLNTHQKYDPNMQMYKLMLFKAAADIAAIPTDVLNTIMYQNDAEGYGRTLNPGFGNNAFKDAVSNTHMYYSSSDGGAMITDAMQFWEEEIIAGTIARNNDVLPDKYKIHVPAWYSSGYCSNLVSKWNTASGRYFGMSSRNMFGWDFLQTNDDVATTGRVRFENECAVPWWPKDITGRYTGNVNSIGRVWYNPLTGLPQAQTQDTSYRAMANVALTTYTSNVVRNLYQTASVMYALPLQTNTLSGVSNVTVALQEPTIGTYAGGYNSNISVYVFKYIPDRCVSNVLIGAPTSNTGAFMMSGPHFLSKTGTTSVTIDLTANITDGVNGTFKTTSSGLADGTVSFSRVFQYGLDDGRKFIPPAYANAHATDLGMVANSGVYQPVTYLLVNNRNCDDINWSDADIQEKLFADQIKPSCVKISVNGTA